jgi:cytochrome b
MAVAEINLETGRNSRPALVRVWDIAVRLFHWSLVIAFAVAWLSADEWDRLHELAGYFIAGLIAFRLVWGIIGTRHARFSDFVVGPTTLINYLRDSLLHRAKRYLGHNPAGGAMVIALLLSLIVVSATGVAMTSNAFWGIEWVEEIHEAKATFTLVFVFLHVAGVIFSSISHKENLIRSMFTGKKKPL